jgi:hypothetical protein
MEIKRMAKKIAAISTGALMLGATLTGAFAAANLADYPAPFIKNGVLDNTVIVVGENAATADVLGAIDIAAALQAAAVVPAGSAGAVAPTVSSGVKVEKSGQKYTYGTYADAIMTNPLDENDLPDLLKAGRFEDDKSPTTQTRNYNQELLLGTNLGEFNLFTPEDGVAGSYLRISDNDHVYTYDLTFQSSVRYRNNDASRDLVGNKIEIQGKLYTITDVSEDDGDLKSITLVAGDSTMWLTQDSPVDWGGHTVTVVDVGNAGTKCGINVDGKVVWINEGSSSSAFPGGLSVSVLEVVETASEGMNACEVSLGSAELVLEDGREIVMNDNEVQGSLVTLQYTADTTNSLWEGFSIEYRANLDETLYLGAGTNAWTDPVFGSWKIQYAGVTAVYEDMEFRSSGSTAAFTFTNVDGRNVKIDYYNDGTDAFLGSRASQPILLPGESATGLTSFRDVRFLYTTPGNDAHMLKISSISCTGDGRITFRDDTYGGVIRGRENQEVNCNSTSPQTFLLGSLGDIELTFEDFSDVTFEDTYGDNLIKTSNDGYVLITTTPSVHITEPSEIVETTQINFTIEYDSSDRNIIFTGLEWGSFVEVEKEYDNSNVMMAVTPKGTLVEFDDDKDRWVKFKMPEKDAYANVFVTPLGVTPTSGAAGGSAVQLNPFNVGLAKLDREVGSLTANMIVVGGPCANSVADQLLNPVGHCGEGFEQGKAMLKFFDRNGKAALLVAGYEAQETLNAAYVLAQSKASYKTQFASLGREVELVVSDMSRVTFNTV